MTKTKGIGTILWLLFGGFLLGWGWLVGAVLLWRSELWTLREKLLGTLVVPGGLAVSLVTSSALLGRVTHGGSSCVVKVGTGVIRCAHVPVTGTASPSVPDYLGAVLLVIGPILTAIYLGRHRRAPEQEQGIGIRSVHLRSA